MNTQPFTLDLPKELGLDFYNGGWIKTVTGIDKSKANGYSLIGEFVNKGLTPVYPGLYLINNIGGSRKNQVNHYYLVAVYDDGSFETVTDVVGRSGYTRGKTGGDWAVQLWEPIEKALVSGFAAAKPLPGETPCLNAECFIDGESQGVFADMRQALLWAGYEAHPRQDMRCELTSKPVTVTFEREACS